MTADEIGKRLERERAALVAARRLLVDWGYEFDAWAACCAPRCAEITRFSNESKALVKRIEEALE